MGISKEDRKAYEDGKKEADNIKKDPLGYAASAFDIIGALNEPSRSKSEDEAYHKGLRGEQLDEDKSSGGGSESTRGGGCYLTTACIESKGLSDDCLELTILREFRDNYLAKMKRGVERIKEYYASAPRIVFSINNLINSKEVYEMLYTDLVKKSVNLIEQGNMKGALKNYFRIYQNFKKEYF